MKKQITETREIEICDCGCNKDLSGWNATELEDHIFWDFKHYQNWKKLNAHQQKK